MFVCKFQAMFLLIIFVINFFPRVGKKIKLKENRGKNIGLTKTKLYYFKIKLSYTNFTLQQFLTHKKNIMQILANTY